MFLIKVKFNWGLGSRYLYEFSLNNNYMSSLRTITFDALIVPSDYTIYITSNNWPSSPPSVNRAPPPAAWASTKRAPGRWAPNTDRARVDETGAHGTEPLLRPGFVRGEGWQSAVIPERCCRRDSWCWCRGRKSWGDRASSRSRYVISWRLCCRLGL